MIDIPKKSKVAVTEKFGAPIQVREVSIPNIDNGEILIQVEMAGICGSDVHVSQGELGLGNHTPPLLQGHEVIGRIVKLGEGRTNDVNGEPLKTGDRIIWEQISCGKCYWCEVENQPLMCQNRKSYGFFRPEELKGGFSEYELISADTKVIKVPEELTNEEAIGVACSFRSVVSGFEKMGGIGFQDNVVIQGCGPIGLYASVAARESNAGKVIVIGSPQERLELAKKWGADHVINIDEVRDPDERNKIILELTNGRGPEVVIEASGYAPAFREGLEMIKRGGTYLILGIISKMEVSILPSMILGKKMTIIGSQSATIRHYHKALQFIKNNKHKYPFSELVTAKFKLEEINEALEYMRLGKGIKPVIDNSGRFRKDNL